MKGRRKERRKENRKKKNRKVPKRPQTPRKTEPNFRPSHPPLHCNPLTSLLWARGQRGVSSQNFRRPSNQGARPAKSLRLYYTHPHCGSIHACVTDAASFFSFFSFFNFFFLFIFLSLSASPSLYGLSASSESYSRRSSSSMDDFSWASCMEFTPRNSRES